MATAWPALGSQHGPVAAPRGPARPVPTRPALDAAHATRRPSCRRSPAPPSCSPGTLQPTSTRPPGCSRRSTPGERGRSHRSPPCCCVPRAPRARRSRTSRRRLGRSPRPRSARATRANAAVILANVRTMQAALDLAGRLDEHAVLAMHRALMAHQALHPAGEWRDQQVWVGGSAAPSRRGALRATRRRRRAGAHGRPRAHSWTVTTSHRSPTPHWPTHSSRRSTRSPTATGAPAAPCCTRCCSTPA